MRGVIYARYSEGSRQTDQSIEGQVRDCRTYAAKHNIDILKVYADKHHTGKDFEHRDQWNHMMKDADDHKFDVIIVWKIDRFGRNREEIAVNKVRLRKDGVTIAYAAENIPDTPEGILLESVLEGLAEYFSEDLKQKVSRGMRESAIKGQHVGGRPPFGYKIVNKKLAIENDEAAAVKMIFQMWVDGSTAPEIENALFADGILSRNGNRVTKSTIYQIINCTKYEGYGIACGIKVDNPQIVSAEVFKAAQERKLSMRHGSTNAKVEYLLSGKCVCGYCGALLVGETGRSASGKQYHYYKCGRTKRGETCELKPIQKEKLEKEIFQRLKKDVLTPEKTAKIIDQIMDKQETGEQEKRILDIEKRIEQFGKQEKNLLSQITISGPSDTTTELLEEIRNNRDDMKHELAEAKLETSILSREFLEFEFERWMNLSDEDAAKVILSNFISVATIKNDAISVEYRIDADSKDVRAGTTTCT